MMAAGRRHPDVFELLEADTRAIEGLFTDYRNLPTTAGSAKRREMLERLCTELIIHMRLEEELLHPRLAAGGGDLLEIGEAHHERMRELVAQLLAAKGHDTKEAARVASLREHFAGHARHRRMRIATRMRASGTDFAPVAEMLVQRRRELRVVAEALREDALASALA